MAQINIYGTLHNDTGEPIVEADQVYDTRDGKSESLTDILDGIRSVTSDPPVAFTDEEMNALYEEVTSEN